MISPYSILLDLVNLEPLLSYSQRMLNIPLQQWAGDAQKILFKLPEELACMFVPVESQGERIIEQFMIVDTAEVAVVITSYAHPGIVDNVSLLRQT